MARQSQIINIKEISGDQYTDIITAQRSARDPLAFAIADVMRRMIDTGLLEIKDGRIQPRGNA
jgi:hypothetical protein